MLTPPVQVTLDEIDRRQKHTELVARAISVLLSAGAHIHGDAVAHGVLLGDALRVDRIDASVTTPLLVRLLPRILAVDYVVQGEDEDSRDDRSNRSVTLRNGRSASVELVLHVHSNRVQMQLPAAMFDFQTLSMSSSSMYGRSPASLASIIARVCTRRFALSSAAGEGDHHALMMRSAMRLLQNGWAMETCVGWAVAYWASLRAGESTCPVCHESFGDQDIVANLACGHNVHVVCNMGSKAGGMCAWLAGGHSTCPCCRADVRNLQRPSSAVVTLGGRHR